jgi:hypothetical protein
MFFEYYVLYWDDLSEENTVVKGVVYATGITEAYQKLIKFFSGDNEDNIIKIHVDAIDDFEGIVQTEVRKALPGERNKA